MKKNKIKTLISVVKPFFFLAVFVIGSLVVYAANDTLDQTGIDTTTPLVPESSVDINASVDSNAVSNQDPTLPIDQTVDLSPKESSIKQETISETTMKIFDGNKSICNGNVDCEALVDLYISTNGQSRTTKTNRGSNDFCSRYGITCKENKVVKIKLQDNNLVGTLPSSLSNLSELSTLYLYKNLIEGSLPTERSSLTKMRYFSLRRNKISGQIPMSWGDNWTNIVLFYINNNEIEGSIPKSFANFIKIKYFSVANNKITGELPKEISTWTKIKKFYVYNNLLEGIFPSERGNRGESIKRFSIKNNKMTGIIPIEALKKRSNIEFFSIKNNLFTGLRPSKKILNRLHAKTFSSKGNLFDIKTDSIQQGKISTTTQSEVFIKNPLGAITIPTDTTIESTIEVDPHNIAIQNVDNTTLGEFPDKDGFADTTLLSSFELGQKGNSLRFSKPIRIQMNVARGDNTEIKLKVDHHDGKGRGTAGLTLNPNATCNNGISDTPATSVKVQGGQAVFYTCSASAFATYISGPDVCNDPNLTIKQSECEGLAEFYGASGGPNWANNTGWGVDPDASHWFGITVTVDRLFVSSITLPGNNLSGTLTGLGKLSALDVLHLENNNLNSTLPNFWTSTTTPGGEIDLQNNNFVGPLPNWAFYGNTKLSFINNCFVIDNTDQQNYINSNGLSNYFFPQRNDCIVTPTAETEPIIQKILMTTGMVTSGSTLHYRIYYHKNDIISFPISIEDTSSGFVITSASHPYYTGLSSLGELVYNFTGIILSGTQDSGYIDVYGIFVGTRGPVLINKATLYPTNDNTKRFESIAQTPFCGNGSKDGYIKDAQSSIRETCDDGNFRNGDGCSDQCQIESGWKCQDTTSMISVLGDIGGGLGLQKAKSAEKQKPSSIISQCSLLPTCTISGLGSQKINTSFFGSVSISGRVLNRDRIENPSFIYVPCQGASCGDRNFDQLEGGKWISKRGLQSEYDLEHTNDLSADYGYTFAATGAYSGSIIGGPYNLQYTSERPILTHQIPGFITQAGSYQVWFASEFGIMCTGLVSIYQEGGGGGSSGGGGDSGGGSVILTKDDCPPNEDYSLSYYDKTCGTKPPSETHTGTEVFHNSAPEIPYKEGFKRIHAYTCGGGFEGRLETPFDLSGTVVNITLQSGEEIIQSYSPQIRKSGRFFVNVEYDDPASPYYIHPGSYDITYEIKYYDKVVKKSSHHNIFITKQCEKKEAIMLKTGVSKENTGQYVIILLMLILLGGSACTYRLILKS